MSQMVECVARAICDTDWVEGTFDGYESDIEDEEGPRDRWREIARAAIAAMREPTEGMVRAGDSEIAHGADPDMLGNARSTWGVMCDEALR